MSDQGRVLPDGWEIRTLESLAANVTSGGTPTSGDPRYYTEVDGLPFAKTEDLTRAKGKHLSDCELQITDAALKASAAKRYPVGSILVSMYGTIGLTKITVRALAANQALSALLPPFECDPDFLYHHLEFMRPRWSRYSGQTTQANISGAIVRAATVAAPPRAEQSAIALILDTLDTQIEKTQTLIAKLEEVKKGLLHDLLSRGVDENGELRPSVEEAPELYKESALGLIPREWEVLVGTDCFDLFGGSIPTNLREDGLGEFMYFKVDDFNNPKNSKGLVQAAATFDSSNSGRVLIYGAGYLVFPKRGAAILHNRVQLFCQPGTVDPNLMLLKPKNGISSTYFREVLLHFGLHNICDNSGIPQINNKHLYPLRFALPGAEEQSVVVTLLEEEQRQISLEREALEKLVQMKTGLMDDLLTGRVRVTPLLECKPAEAT